MVNTQGSLKFYESEDAGLVHMTANIQNGPLFICNCCGCCCGVLTSINDLGIPASHVVNSHYYAEIDPAACSSCGICSDKRCQVGAVEETENEFRIIREKCIGCGLCISKCPQEAIRLVHKEEADRTPPVTENAWFEERGKKRGVDYSPYK
jgi:electron transport complex protein RnfB